MSSNPLDKLFLTSEAVIGAARDVTDAVTRGYDSIRNPIQADSRRNVPMNSYGQPAQPVNYDRFVTEYPYSSCTQNASYGYNWSGSANYQPVQNAGYYGFTDPTYGKVGATALNTSRSIFGNNNGVGGIFSNGKGDIFGGGL